MRTSLTMTELRSMTHKDLGREIRSKQTIIGALRLAVSIGKEKNTSLYKKAKRELAQLQTVFHEKEPATSLNFKEDTATVRAQS